jgi:hypothetical protein
MSKVLYVFHAKCADGLGAAWAVHRALGDDAEFVAASYVGALAKQYGGGCHKSASGFTATLE